MSLIDALNQLPALPASRNDTEALAARRREARDAVLARHGSPEAVRAVGPDEAALVESCRPLIESGRLDAHFPPQPGEIPADVAEAVRGALPFPATVAEALREYRRWDGLTADRSVLEGEHMQPVAIGCRLLLLEEALDTLPAVDFADIEARLAWMQAVLDFGFSRDVRADQACLDALKGDVARLTTGGIPVPIRGKA